MKEDLALYDLTITDLTKRKGYFHCFCKNMLTKDGSSKTKAYKFKGDKDKTHCVEWISSKNMLSLFALAIASSVGLINVLVEIFIGLGTEKITRPKNLQETIV